MSCWYYLATRQTEFCIAFPGDFSCRQANYNFYAHVFSASLVILEYSADAESSEMTFPESTEFLVTNLRTPILLLLY